MSALGQKQPLNNLEILSSEWLLSARSGHSPLNSSGCFRPKAASRLIIGDYESSHLEGSCPITGDPLVVLHFLGVQPACCCPIAQHGWVADVSRGE
jgi:hypothetical protein